MEKNKIFESLALNIVKGGELSPFLFLSSNLELLHSDIELFIGELFLKNSIDTQSLFHLQDTGESIKIDEIKRFIAAGDTRPRFAFQIFLIENISRMTLQAANACLKFFEEPGKGNIIFLTNASQANVLDTILSRVQIQNIEASTPNLHSKTEAFYTHMIETHISKSSDELVGYFFSGKYEKQEYVSFLRGLMAYIIQHPEYMYLVDELYEDIGGVLKNNLQGKYVTDKYIMLLSRL